jgi:uncharacterized protein involved in exopolysaccharide biosynthesis
MNRSERIRRVVEYRFPAWLAAVVVVGLIVAIKFMTG